MKKRYILLILLTAFTLATTAQNLTTKAMVVYKTNHTQDTILWKSIVGGGTYFYGKENPTENDYVTLSFSFDENGMTYSTCLTPAGKQAPFQTYGTMLSTNHIDVIPENMYIAPNLIYFVDKKQWYGPDYGTGNGEVIRYDNVKEYFSFTPGQVFYVRAVYILDDKPYFSSEIAARAPKTRNIMRELVYDDYISLNDSILFKADVAKMVEDNKEMFTDTTAYERQIVLQYVHSVLSGMATSVVMAMVTKTEICDNGMLYIIDDVPSSVKNDALNIINEEVFQPFYVQANLKTVYDGSGVTTDFGTRKCTPTIYEVDEKWGIRDNQYLYTNLQGQGTTAKPSLALMMNHLMKPGKVYDVTLTFAPNIQDEEADTLNTYFYVSIADEMNNGKMPTLTNAQTFGNDTTVKDRGLFIARPRELKVMTMEYTPANFTNVHVLQLNHQFSFTTSANRRRYGQEFRVVGIEVKPHE